jgi:ribosome-binding protein aMBF1 (putative translation factor)
MAYVMTEEYSKNPTMPSYYYYEGIKEGFRQNGLPVAALRRALQHTQEEVKAIERGKSLPETEKSKKKKRNNPER